jgi:hypothetical protein
MIQLTSAVHVIVRTEEIRKMTKYLILIFVFLFQQFAFTQKLDRSILGYQDDKSFWLDIPSGWYQDADIANRFGAIFFLLPDGYDFNNAPAVIYASSYKHMKLKEAISYDKEISKGKDPNIKISNEQYVISSKEKKITYLIFESKAQRSQPFEAVAYIEENDVVFTIAISALTKEAFMKMLPVYKNMLASYEIAGIKVIDHTKDNKK